MMMNKEQIAKTCHEVNKAYCESIGDFSQPKWEDVPEWQKESAIKRVDFHLQYPETKERPCIVLYDQLPKQQAKDALFIAVVRSFE